MGGIYDRLSSGLNLKQNAHDAYELWLTWRVDIDDEAHIFQ